VPHRACKCVHCVKLPPCACSTHNLTTTILTFRYLSSVITKLKLWVSGVYFEMLLVVDISLRGKVIIIVYQLTTNDELYVNSQLITWCPMAHNVSTVWNFHLLFAEPIFWLIVFSYNKLTFRYLSIAIIVSPVQRKDCHYFWPSLKCA